MTKHTPGPWEDAGTALYAGNVKIGQMLDTDAAELYGENILPREEWRSLMVQYEEAQANARLIAAAPDLLAAAEEAVRWYDNTGDTITAAPWIYTLRAAIARARGEE